VDDCGRVSHDLSAILDVEPELVGGPDRSYTLEVSSPGLDRPLRRPEDYERFAGRRAKLVMREKIDGQGYFKGQLGGIENGHVLIEGEDKRTHRVPIDVITKAHLEVEF
jgi:ribosome maturation factor RimP